MWVLDVPSGGFDFLPPLPVWKKFFFRFLLFFEFVPSILYLSSPPPKFVQGFEIRIQIQYRSQMCLLWSQIFSPIEAPLFSYPRHQLGRKHYFAEIFFHLQPGKPRFFMETSQQSRNKLKLMRKKFQLSKSIFSNFKTYSMFKKYQKIRGKVFLKIFSKNRIIAHIYSQNYHFQQTFIVFFQGFLKNITF